jgi:hypothetical protein
MSTTEPGIQTIEQPHRRRWKHWVALSAVLMLGCGAWVVSRESPTIRRAQKLRLRMTEPEVRAVMGEPVMTLGPLQGWHDPSDPERWKSSCFATRSEDWILEKRVDLECFLSDLVPRETIISIYDVYGLWPVQVDFENGRVVRIRRGDEIVDSRSRRRS